MQERLAAYKKKMEAKKAQEATQKLEKKKKQDEKINKRMAKQLQTQKLIEEEKRKAKAKMEEVKQARLDAMKKQQERQEQQKKDREAAASGKAAPASTNHSSAPSTRGSAGDKRSKLQRTISKKSNRETLDAEHGIMVDAEKTFEKQEKAMQSRLNTYKVKLDKRKAEEAAEKAEKERQKEEERRKREQEAEAERKRIDAEMAALKQKAKVEPAKRPVKKYGGGATPWQADKSSLEQAKAKQEGKIMTWREKQEAKKKKQEEDKKKKEAEEKEAAEKQAEKERQDAMNKMNASMSVCDIGSSGGKEDSLAPLKASKGPRRPSQIAAAQAKFNTSFSSPADYSWKKKRNSLTINDKKAELERLAEERKKADVNNIQTKEMREEAARVAAAEKKQQALDKERAEAKRRAEEDAKARFEAQRRRDEEQAEKKAAQKRKEEEEKAKAAAAKRQQELEASRNEKKAKDIANAKQMAEKRAAEEKAEKEAAEKRRQDAERAEKARKERQKADEEARIANEKRRKEAEDAKKAQEERKAKEKAEKERLEKEREKEETSRALEEAKRREHDRARAKEEQEKAIKAADAARAKARGGVADSESESEEESDDDDDEDWNAEEKARFLAEAKAEVAKKKALMAAKAKKEEAAQKRASIAKHEEEERKAAAAERHQRELITDTTPDFLLEIEAAGFEEDEDLEEAVGDFHKVRDYIAALQTKRFDSEQREAAQIREVEDRFNMEKEKFRAHATAGLQIYTKEEEEDIMRQSTDCKEIIQTLRKQNTNIRESCKSMAEEMRSLYIHNQRLEEAKKTTTEFQGQLTAFENKESGKGEQLETLATRLKEAIDDHEEAVSMRAMVGETENKVKLVYERCATNLVGKFQTESTDDVLVLEIGSIALGEMAGMGGDTSDEEEETLSVSRSFHQINPDDYDDTSGSEFEEESVEESEEEEEVISDYSE